MLNLVSQIGTRVEVQDETGKAIPGFTLDDCTSLIGDGINQLVAWKGGSLAKLAGKPVRLRFRLIEADLFALQFVP